MEKSPRSGKPSRRGGRRTKIEGGLEPRQFPIHIGKERMTALHAALAVKAGHDLSEDEIVDICRDAAYAAISALQEQAERDNEAIIV